MFIKELKKKEIKDRTKIMFGVNMKGPSENNFDIKILIDDCRIPDVNYPMSFSTFIFVSEKTPEGMAKHFIKNVKEVPGLVGMVEPDHFAINKYRTLVHLGKKKNYNEEKVKGGITDEISLSEMLADDYNASIYNEFKEFLPEINEM